MRGKILNWESPDILIHLDKGVSLVITYRDVYKHCLWVSLWLFHLTLLFPATLCITFPPFSKNKLPPPQLPCSAWTSCYHSASALAISCFAVAMVYTNLELSKS